MRVITSLFILLLVACAKDAPTPGATVSPNLEETTVPTLPYGSWPSPVSAESLVEGARGIGGLRKEGDFFYWLESRPEQGGRTTIMRWREGEEGPTELLPEPWNVRTRVHEYGGGALLVAGDTLWFSNFADQRLYRFRAGEEPVAITPKDKLRFAGCTLDAARNRLICIREDHRGLEEPVNNLVSLALEEESEGDVLFSGTDFVSAPRLSADGQRIAFTSWMHPNMPWDTTRLHTAAFDDQGQLVTLRTHNPDRDESVIDPQWADDGRLFVVSDRDNWWRPYVVEGDDFVPVETGLEDVEIGGSNWGIGAHYYHLLPGGELLVAARRGSVEQLYRIDAKGNARLLDTGAVDYGSVVVDKDKLYLAAAFAAGPDALVRVDSQGAIEKTIRTSRDSALEAAWIPPVQQVTFPLPGGDEAHGVYLAPTNPTVTGPDDAAPPLIVSVHGGPTSVARASYQPSHYFWTSRGFAVLDLNYRGSTGFGRAYRRALYGQWGIRDIEDAAAGATWLAAQGMADLQRLIIRGGSAGGYTTLAAHAQTDTFAAGASYYGISDIEALAKETHKFESRYLDQLIGPYPERRDLYLDRSPIQHLDGFKAPLILLQGLDDPVVPPNQSEMIYEALKGRGIPTAYIAFEGESHGFRKAENQVTALQAELYFYSQVLGFPTADSLPEISIDNLAP